MSGWRPDADPHGHATRPTWSMAAPFIGVAAMGVLAMLVQPTPTNGFELVLAVALLALAVVMLGLGMRQPTRTWLEPAAAYVAFLFIAVARDATGGASSGLTGLVLLPLLWLALTGTKNELRLAAGFVFAIFAVPALVIGGEAYPESEWRRVVIWLAIALLIAPVVQGLVMRLAVETRATRAVNAQMESILRGARLTSIITVDLDGRVETFNAGAERLLGYQAAEVIGRRASVFLDRDELASVSAALGLGADPDQGLVALAELARLDAPSRTWTYVRKDGARRFVRLVVTELKDGDGAVRGFLAVGIDATESARMRHELLVANQRNERLFEDAPHGVAVLDMSGRIQRANASLRAILGARATGELLGRPLASFGDPDDPSLQHHLERLLTERDLSASADCRLRDLDGQAVAVTLTSTLLRGEPTERDDTSDDVVLVNVVDVSERRQYEDRLAHLADHDPLTGLPNRRRFDEELARHLEQCRRYGVNGAVLLLDLDNFKQVNDTLGHPAGDELLVGIAGLLRRELRSGDLVARLGGDEFAVLLPVADAAATRTVAEAVVRRICDHAATLDGVRRRVTASVGAVTFTAAHGRDMDILALADMTMYDAKEAGRNRVSILEEDSDRLPRSGARLEWQNRIEAALEHDRFVLHFQPIVDVETSEVVSAEVLLRMRHEGELVAPGRFLYIAERVGLMPRVDTWVLEQGIAALARLREIRPDLRLAVNLSATSMGDSSLEEAIIDALLREGVPPEALVLEITETAAVSDLELARRFGQRMSRVGCRFALDDFGAGFGSFYYLKHLIFDYVKIDGEFVAASHRSQVDRIILRAIVGIARDLGKRTVAEFVGEPEVLDIVREEGVDLAQGFLIGKPVPYDEFVSRFLTVGPMVEAGAGG